MTARRLSPLSLSAFLCSSVGLWASCGTLGVAGIDPGAPRLGVLPSFWWLGAAVAVSAVLLLLFRPVPKRVAVLWLSLLLVLPWLPWLPQPIASAALIFTGHLRAFVWIGIAIGLAAPVAIAAV